MDPMFSNSGFPFAPDYLNTLRLGPTVEDEVSPRRKGPRSKKRSASSIEKHIERETKVRVCKTKAIKPTPMILVPSDTLLEQLPVIGTIKTEADETFSIPVIKANSSREWDLLDFQPETSVPSALRYDDSNLYIMLRVSKADVKAISGYCYLTLLKGYATLNGYELSIGERMEIMNSNWSPSAILSTEYSPSASSCTQRPQKGVSMGNFLEGLDLSLANNVENPHFRDWISDSKILVLVEGISKDKQEWLLAAEDQSMYHEFSRPDYAGEMNGRKADKKWWLERLNPGSDSIFGVCSAVIGESSAVSRRLSVELLDVPPSWASSVTSLLQESSREECRNSRTVICGAKGVGKSTCVRHTVNQLLSKTDAVAVIDCDLGQPEFTVPGLLSLHIISKPILSPTHMHLNEPVLSYFIGDLTSKNEPELFSKALSALVAKYNQLQHDLLEERTRSRVRAECDINSFSLLDVKKEVITMVPLPLVVNTDGSVRYMGAEVLSAVMELVMPTHVLHISSEKDRDLPAVVNLRDLPSKAATTHIFGSGDSTRVTNMNNDYKSNCSSSSNDNSSIKLHQNNFSSSTSPPSICHVLTLDPGRLRASKIASVDLRTLRIVSYFLRGETALRTKVRAEQAFSMTPILPKGLGDDTYGPKGLSSSNSLSSIQSESAVSLDGEVVERPMTEGSKESPAPPKISKKILAQMAGEGFHIRKGALVDTAGAISLKFMESIPLGVRFSEIVLQVQSGSVPPRLMLAAMNASMVGIVYYPRHHAQQFTSTSSSSSSGVDCIRRVRLRSPRCHAASRQGLFDREGANGEEEWKEEEDLSMSEFDIYCNVGSESQEELPVCLGLGIVRAIDIEERLIYLLTPLTPSQINNVEGRITLVRGQLQIPSILLYTPELMSVHPYMSSEITGEGSAVMKARNNVKRRSQQN